LFQQSHFAAGWDGGEGKEGLGDGQRCKGEEKGGRNGELGGIMLWLLRGY